MYHGVICVDKPKGMTSHDVVSKVRRILHMKKVGHTGTLDPDVTGVLAVVVGQATQLTEILQERQKSYEAVVTLGVSTDTEDASGKVTQTSDVSHITTKMIDETIENFEREYYQTVPMYSSVKVNGKKLYEYARNGESVTRPNRVVYIHDLKRTGDINFGETIDIPITVTCSKGTYVRTLAVDIGRKLGVDAHMSYLRRTESCGFTIDDSVELDDVTSESIIPILDVLDDFYKVELKDELEARGPFFKTVNGQKMSQTDMMKLTKNEDVETVLFIKGNRPIGIYKKHKENEYKPFKMFLSSNDL